MSIAAAFRLQLTVIWALILRELHTRYGRENIGFLWVVGEPILFCGGVAIAWDRRPPGARARPAGHRHRDHRLRAADHVAA